MTGLEEGLSYSIRPNLSSQYLIHTEIVNDQFCNFAAVYFYE